MFGKYWLDVMACMALLWALPYKVVVLIASFHGFAQLWFSVVKH
jgi:hypothetical protein